MQIPPDWPVSPNEYRKSSLSAWTGFGGAGQFQKGRPSVPRHVFTSRNNVIPLLGRDRKNMNPVDSDFFSESSGFVVEGFEGGARKIHKVHLVDRDKYGAAA